MLIGLHGLQTSDILNYLAAGITPSDLTSPQKERFFTNLRHYLWEDPILYRRCVDQMIRRCIPKNEMRAILLHYHSLECGGHFSGQRTIAKVLQSGFYWPTLFKDAHSFVKTRDRCQRTGNISSKNEMPLNSISEVEMFVVWGIDFMGPFLSFCGNKYILLAVEYLSKWVEAIPTVTCDAKVVLKFLLKHIVSRFGTPRAIVSDEGKHFCNKLLESLLSNYGVRYRTTLAYHPQCNGQVEISNREIKFILEKIVNVSQKDWSAKMDNAL